MKDIAIGIVIVIFLSVLVEPLLEVANVFREKVMLGAALSNATRAAKDSSLQYESHRDLDAVIEEDKFRDYFSEAFEKAMNVTRTNGNRNTLTFNSNDGNLDPITVTFDISEETDLDTEQLITTVEVEASTRYKFQTKYLKLAEDASEDVDYQLTAEKQLILSIKN